MLKVIAGPCVIESEKMVMQIAQRLKSISESIGFHLIFKASLDKANRTSIESYRGPGFEKGLKIMEKVKNELELDTITDIHLPDQAQPVSEVVDYLQIPAFLCRQTDLLIAAGKTNKVVNIKKGQFLSASSMQHAVDKVRSVSNVEPMVCERGTFFGYQDLVVDMRSLPTLKESCQCPVIMDITHSVQKPGAGQGCTGGNRNFIPTLAKSAIAAGVDGVFLETHPNPDEALSDGPNSWPLDLFEQLLKQIVSIHELVHSQEDLVCLL